MHVGYRFAQFPSSSAPPTSRAMERWNGRRLGSLARIRVHEITGACLLGIGRQGWLALSGYPRIWGLTSRPALVTRGWKTTGDEIWDPIFDKIACRCCAELSMSIVIFRARRGNNPRLRRLRRLAAVIFCSAHLPRYQVHSHPPAREGEDRDGKP